MKFLASLLVAATAIEAAVIEFYPAVNCPAAAGKVSVVLSDGVCNPVFSNKMVRTFNGGVSDPINLAMTSCSNTGVTFAMYGPNCDVAFPGVQFTAFPNVCISTPFTSSSVFGSILGAYLPGRFASYKLVDTTCSLPVVQLTQAYTQTPPTPCDSGVDTTSSFTGLFALGENACSQGYYMSGSTFTEYSAQIMEVPGGVNGTSYTGGSCGGTVLGVQAEPIPTDGSCFSNAYGYDRKAIIPVPKTIPTPAPVPAAAPTDLKCYVGTGKSVIAQTTANQGNVYCYSMMAYSANTQTWTAVYGGLSQYAPVSIGYGVIGFDQPSYANFTVCNTELCNPPPKTANSALANGVVGLLSITIAAIAGFILA